MSCQQNQQKYQLPAKCLPKYPPKWPPQAPQAPQTPASCPPPVPSYRISSCCVSGFGGCCSLMSHRFPRVYLCQPPSSSHCERESSGCSSCCRGLGGHR